MKFFESKWKSAAWIFGLSCLSGFSPGACADDVPYTIDSLSRSLSNRTVTDQEDILGLLPNDFLSRYTLIYKSRSLQAATPQGPRVILAGPGAEFVLAFTDVHAAYGGEAVEAIQYRRDQARFEFYLISADSNGRYQVNPGQGCVNCHGADLRPNFQPYATWPGFFGSDDDRLQGGVSLPQEQGWLNDFVLSAPSRARYRVLQGLEESYKPINGVGSRTWVPHNFELTFRFAQLNYRRISRILSERGDWPKMKYAWLASIACGVEIAGAFPEGSKPPAGMSFNDFAEVQAGKTPAFVYMMNRFGLDPAVLTTQAPGITAEPFRGNLFGSGGSSATEMVGQLLDWDPELAEYGSAFDYHHQEMSARFGEVLNCQRLVEKSRTALSSP